MVNMNTALCFMFDNISNMKKFSLGLKLMTFVQAETYFYEFMKIPS